MTEPPADLLETLARELAPYDLGPRETVSDRHEPPRVILAALTEWATGPDGTVAWVDPVNWTRWDREEVGKVACVCPWPDNDLGPIRHRPGCSREPFYRLTPREDRHADPT